MAVILDLAHRKNLIADYLTIEQSQKNGGEFEMCCHTDNKHEHAHEHAGEKHVHEHIHEAEHKHGHKCCH